MHPGQRFSYALLLSLGLWFPTLRAALDGGIDPLDASLRWVVAFAVTTTGVRLIGGLVDRYAGTVGLDLTDGDDEDAEERAAA